MESVLLDLAGHRRSPATMPGYHRGRPPRNSFGSARVGPVWFVGSTRPGLAAGAADFRFGRSWMVVGPDR